MTPEEKLVSMGCTNHGCLIFDSGGMRTNGPCHCVRNLPDHLLRQVLAIKNTQIEELKAEVERVRAVVNASPETMTVRFMAEELRRKEAEALLDEIANIGEVHQSWNAGYEFVQGWRDCRELVQEILAKWKCSK